MPLFTFSSRRPSTHTHTRTHVYARTHTHHHHHWFIRRAQACMFLPVIVLKARKFSLLFSMGSLASLGSLAMLRGPGNFAKFLLTRERAPYTLFYLGTLFATLYCAMGLKQTIPTIVAAALQFAVVLSYFSAYVPGGMFGLRMLAKLWWTTMKNVVYPCCSACAKRLVS